MRRRTDTLSAGVSSRLARLGVDIGGTFTDATIVDGQTGEVRSVKVLTTPSDPSEGFTHAVRRALADAHVEAETAEQIVHATTVATNAIVEDKAAPTAFITTAGFRDMFEIARQVRPSLYDLRFVKAP